MPNKSDIITELLKLNKTEIAKQNSGCNLQKYKGQYGLRKEFYEVNNTTVAKLLNKDFGKYTLIAFPNLFISSINSIQYLINHLSMVVKQYLGTVNSKLKVLVVALGNRHISADSLGVAAIKNVIITKNLFGLEKFKHLPEVYAFATSVFGVTGMESSTIINSIIKEIQPDKLIVIDTLCAANYKRLGTNFQINNAGITPGSGIGNARKTINKDNNNIETISIGVPLVVYAKSFISNAIDDINLKQILRKIDNKNANLVRDILFKLEKYDFDNMIVTLKDIEHTVNLCGKIIGFAINKALLGLSYREQTDILQIL